MNPNEKEAFYEKWDLDEYPEYDYSFWTSMLDEMKANLDAERFAIIPYEVNRVFGVSKPSSLVNSDDTVSTISGVALPLPVTRKEDRSPANNELDLKQLKAELRAWKYENIIKFLTEYIIDRAIRDMDYEKLDQAVIKIGNQVLDPLLVCFYEAHLRVGNAIHQHELQAAGRAEILQQNYRTILLNLELLKKKDSYILTYRFDGSVVVKPTPAPTQKPSLLRKLRKEVKASKEVISQEKSSSKWKTILPIAAGVILGVMLAVILLAALPVVSFVVAAGVAGVVAAIAITLTLGAMGGCLGFAAKCMVDRLFPKSANLPPPITGSSRLIYSAMPGATLPVGVESEEKKEIQPAPATLEDAVTVSPGLSMERQRSNHSYLI
jgi:hypothetical protein